MNKQVNDKKIFRLVALVTTLVFSLVILLKSGLIEPSVETPKALFKLPLLNAIINATCTVLLLISLWAIKNKKIQLHKKINITTFALSALFLISYVIFHFFVSSTSYCGPNSLKTFYFIILISHIILAALVLPLILISFWFGLQMKVKQHKKIVRFTYPIWLYVTITGVIVYIMISPCYNF